MNRRSSLKLVVIDDDLPVREELRRFNWSSLDVIFSGEATNGLDGIALCRNVQPDIIFLDITMPVMDGFEMLKKLKDILPKTQVVILTCHKNYSYMREAMQMGVSDYLLKTDLEEEEISNVMQRLRNKITSYHPEDHIKQNDEKIRSSAVFMEYLTTGNISSGSWPIINFPCMSVILLTTSHTFPSCIYNCLSTYESYGIQWFIIDTSHIIMLIGEPILKKHIKNLDEVYRDIQKAIGDMPLYIIEGSRAGDSYELKKAYKNVMSRQNLVFYEKCGVIDLEVKDLCQPEAGTINEMKLKFYSMMNDDMDFERFMKDDFYCWACSNLIHPLKLESMVLTLCSEWLGESLDNNDDNIMIFLKSYKPTIEEFIEVSLTLMHQLLHKKTYRQEIRRAISIIHRELHTPIKASQVADMVGLSPGYLSKIFFEETGFTFNDYLLMARLEKAKELLINTNYKIYQIAEDVGIPNYRYFSYLFKKEVGCSPKEYALSGLKLGVEDEHED